MTRPSIPTLLTCLASLVAAAPAAAHPALDRLIPLIEVYDARLADTPEFDVAGIRCAALFIAQQLWSESHGGEGRPSAARLADIERNLTQAELARRDEGMGLSRAYSTTLDDARRVIDLYSAHFRVRETGEGLPWQGDPLISGDTNYCDLLGNRR